MFSEIITAIILGIIQGLTEFIPVSSSGHLLLTTELLNLTNSSFSFELALNLGTLLALIGYFWRDILAIIKMLKKPKTQGLPAKIVVATIPAVIIGALALPLVSTVLRSPIIAIVALIVVGIIMILSDRLIGNKTVDELSLKNALMIGFSQALAFIPGTSRSGITIIAGRLTGLSHKQAARFSFLMAIPIVTLALLKLLLDFNTQDMERRVSTDCGNNNFILSRPSCYSLYAQIFGKVRSKKFRILSYYHRFSGTIYIN